MPAFHLAYGLRLQADVPLPGLPIYTEALGQDVRIHIGEKSVFSAAISTSPGDLLHERPDRSSPDYPNLRVFRLEGGKLIGFFYQDGARFAVSREGNEIWADWPDGYSLEDGCTYLIGPVLAYALRLRGVTCLHASAIAVDDRAIALMGESGAGKSTTAAAFAQLGFAVLSDDVAVLGESGGHFQVQPGYPRINMWPDSVRSFFRSEDALPAITPTWEKRYLALDQSGLRFQSSALPLGGIYILDERGADLTAPFIEEVAGGEAMIALVANAYVNYLLDPEMQVRDFDVFKRLLAGVRVRRVRPPADPARVFALCQGIVADATRIAISTRPVAVHGAV